MHKVKVLDCTIRDGGYLNQWRFEPGVARDVYRAASKAGVDVVEIGFRGTRKNFDPDKFGPWRFCDEELLRETVKGGGAEVALMADFGKIEADDFCERKDSAAGMIRVAAHRGSLKDAVALLEKIKIKGYRVVLNAMGYTGMSEPQRRELRKIVKGSGIDILYVADSYGSIFPNQIEGIFAPWLEMDGPEIGFHPHNNLQMAFANTIEAARLGVHYVDATMYGMGRGAGNLPVETLLAYLQLSSKDKYNVVPILNCIDQHLIALKKEFPWGYQLPYMLSGIFQCHPSYPKDLIERHEYTAEDVWRALERVRKEAPVGYDKALLEKIVSDGMLSRPPAKAVSGKTLKKTSSKKTPVPYLDRHKGKDFLILAGGPSLVEYKSRIADFIKRYDPIVLGANNMGGHFVPDYHAFSNKKRFMTFVKTVHADSKLLLSEYMSEDMIKEHTTRAYESLRYVDQLTEDFAIEKGVINSNCRTVAVLLCAVAAVMGAKRVFVAGLDGYTQFEEGKRHFYKEKDEPESQDEILERHRWCLATLSAISNHLSAAGKEELHIITPTSYQKFHKGIRNYLPDAETSQA